MTHLRNINIYLGLYPKNLENQLLGLAKAPKTTIANWFRIALIRTNLRSLRSSILGIFRSSRKADFPGSLGIAGIGLLLSSPCFGMISSTEKLNPKPLQEIQNFQEIKDFAHQMPKIELHVHLEGTLTPKKALEFARRNKLSLPEGYNNLKNLEKAYSFKDLFDFLKLYTICSSTLQTEQDFRELTMEYLTAAHRQGIVHAEFFVSFQVHMARGIPFTTIIKGIKTAMDEAESKLGITSSVILDINREESEASAIELLDIALADKNNLIVGVGLEYAENEANPPHKFVNFYEKARAAGMHATAHAGEAFGSEYVKEAVECLKVDRIDHGVRAIEDEAVINLLVDKKIPLTISPLSNVCLKVYEKIEDHPIKKLIDRGVQVTVNSDDPGYFRGNMVQNYDLIIDTFFLSMNEVYQLGKNSIMASFLSEKRKADLLIVLDKLYCKCSGQKFPPMEAKHSNL